MGPVDNLCITYAQPVDKRDGGGLRCRGTVTVPSGIQKSSNLGLYLGGHMQS
jgi:hypothetical protein